jgi:hypothetical protein
MLNAKLKRIIGKDESDYFQDSVPQILIYVTGCSIIYERQSSKLLTGEIIGTALKQLYPTLVRNTEIFSERYWAHCV